MFSSPMNYGMDDRVIMNLSIQNLCKQSYLKLRED